MLNTKHNFIHDFLEQYFILLKKFDYLDYNYTESKKTKSNSKETIEDIVKEYCVNKFHILYGFYTFFDAELNFTSHIFRQFPERFNPDGKRDKFIPIPVFESKVEEKFKDIFYQLRKNEKYDFWDLPDAYRANNWIYGKANLLHQFYENTFTQSLNKESAYNIILSEEILFFLFGKYFLEQKNIGFISEKLRLKINYNNSTQITPNLKQLVKFACSIEAEVLEEQKLNDFFLVDGNKWNSENEGEIRRKIELEIDSKLVKGEVSKLIAEVTPLINKIVKSLLDKVKFELNAISENNFNKKFKNYFDGIENADSMLWQKIARFNLNISEKLIELQKFDAPLHDILLFPILKSTTGNFETDKFFYEECIEKGAKVKIEVPFVMTNYITTLYGLDRSLLDEDKESLEGFNITMEVCKNFAKPIVDEQFYSKLILAKLKPAAIKAAISQVMARNSSHNIGSHVLNKLSGDLSELIITKEKPNYNSVFEGKKFGNSIDEERLNQLSKFNNYIKCRMDYLSDITFGTPAMQITKRLHSEILSDLDDVRLLLENISGLSDFKYSLKIDSSALKNETDPAIAMPNDILGCQAFYNIIENIIRNTAKHSDKKELEGNVRNIEELVEFEIRISEIEEIVGVPDTSQYYKVEVFDNVIVSGHKIFEENDAVKDEFIKDNDLKEQTEIDSTINNLTNLDYLIYSQNKKLNASILTEKENTLRSTSLGLIEMEASACYLRKMDISELESDDYQIDFNDKIFNKKNKLNILKAVAIDGKHLGYRFFVLKPTEVLLVGNYELSDELKNNGFLQLSYEAFRRDLEAGKVFNHQFLVYEDDKTIDLINYLETVKGIDDNEIQVSKYKALLPKRLIKLIKSDFKLGNKTASEVMKFVWECWATQEGLTTKKLSIKVPESEPNETYHILNHGKHELNGDQLSNFCKWYNDDSNKYYIEALSSNGKSKLPNYQSNTLGGNPAEAMTNYYNLLKKMEGAKFIFPHLRYPIIEAAQSKIVIIDERVQYAAYNNIFEEYPFYKYYQHSNIIVPKKEIDLGANDLYSIKSDIEKFLIPYLNENHFLVIHYSIIERFYNSSQSKESDVHKWLNFYSSKTNVVVTSGRGIIKNLSPNIHFINLSPLLASVIDFRSKYYLHQIIMSSRKSN